MLSEGAGLPEWLVVQAACTKRSLVVLLYSLSPTNLPFYSPAPRFVALVALPAVTSSTNKQSVRVPAEPAQLAIFAATQASLFPVAEDDVTR